MNPVAIRPNASPDSAPTISEGENMPPPMRPPKVIATAAVFSTVNTIASCSSRLPLSATSVVSYPTPMIWGYQIASPPSSAPASAGRSQRGMRVRSWT